MYQQPEYKSNNKQAKQRLVKPIFQREEKSNRTGLPDNLKDGIQRLSGYDMSDVKVHYNSSKPAQLNAHAYAQGTQIHLGAGQERHLPHEAWHVVQQKQGRVRPTMKIGGQSVNDNEGLEREADVMGGKALQMKAKKSNVKEGFGFVDNRPEAIAQRKSQEMMNISLQTIQLNVIQLYEFEEGEVLGSWWYKSEGDNADLWESMNGKWKISYYRESGDYHIKGKSGARAKSFKGTFNREFKENKASVTIGDEMDILYSNFQVKVLPLY